MIRFTQEGRYHRQELISWWDQERVRKARVLVVGAGALGNEVLKLLALTGIGNVLIFDMDVIEESNLARTVLFRSADQGLYKADVAALRISQLNPDVLAVGRPQNVIEGAGLGVFHWADVIVSGVDNRLARIFVNKACAAVGRIWVDGAVEELSGTVRVFNPAEGVCYECTMNAIDRKLVRERMSCAMLARDAAAAGHVPSTAVAASVIAGLQVQEAIKHLHGQPTLVGKGIHINGLGGDFHEIEYPRREDCLGHQYHGAIEYLGCRAADWTLDELLRRAEENLGDGAVLDLSRDVVYRIDCPMCEWTTVWAQSLLTVGESDATCSNCGAHCSVAFTSSISRDGDVDLSRTPAGIGIPPFDIIVARRGFEERRAWLFDQDAKEVLGSLAAGDPELGFVTEDQPEVPL